MPTRSITLKLIVPRSPERSEAAEALWATHALVNEAVRYYEAKLLLMRGESYLGREHGPNPETVPRETVRSDLLRLVDAARAVNMPGSPPADVDAVALLADLFACIVREGADARNANGFMGPLTDPKSDGYLNIFSKIDNAPDWVAAVRDGDPDGFARAHAWLETEAGQARLRATGRPTAWVKAAKAKDSGWPAAFVADLDKNTGKAEGAPTVVRRLKEAGILPLFPPFFAPRMVKARGAVSPWDRLALRLAAAHLLSWRSWDQKAREDHAARRAKLQSFKDKHLTAAIAPAIAALREYERARREELAQRNPGLGDVAFVITGRMVRGWPALLDKLRKARDRSEEALRALLAKEQTARRGGFGDPDLFRWLVAPERHWLWTGEDDPVSIIATLNALEHLLARSRDAATMTLPDPCLHPRAPQWEAEGGTNLKTYALRRRADGMMEVELPVLRRLPGDGSDPGAAKLAETTITLALAPSGQFRDPVPSKEAKKPVVAYSNDAGERFKATIGSADLILDRAELGRRSRDPEAAAFGTAYLKLALDVGPEVPEDETKTAAQAVRYFTGAGKKAEPFRNAVAPGLRVLSVDLGLRVFATCSVFVLTDVEPPGGLYVPVKALNMWAVHERSFPLDLPGADGGRAGEAWRRDAEAELRRLERGLERHRALLRAAAAAPEDRAAFVAAWGEALRTGDAWPFEAAPAAALEAALGAPPPAWADSVERAAGAFRTGFGTVVAAWRARTRARGSGRLPGKSMWSIEHLTRVRRFLMRWSLAGRASGDVRRWDGAKRGVFAAGLLEHLEGIKDDRLKTGADLIVQAARGYRRAADGSWVKAHPRCDAVLFEDLWRYRTRTDRPRRENRQLMQWCHRSILKETRMQAELYGLQVAETGAAFSSRYAAATMTPGIRCRPLTAADLGDPGIRDMLLRENEGLDLDALRPGMLVPLSGGAVFASIAPDGPGVRTIHADVNAAQNLQRRFWTRHGDAFRIPARRVRTQAGEGWVPLRLDDRALGALGGHGWLRPAGREGDAFSWQRLTAAEWKALSGGKDAAPDVAAPDLAAADLATDLVAPDLADHDLTDPGVQDLIALEEERAERSGKVTVFFRDPSGFVLDSRLWFPSAVFWSIVKAKTRRLLR